VATVAGFGLWGFLIRTYSASTIAPFSLLVPVFGMTSAALFTGEEFTPTRIVAAVLIITGVLSGLWKAPAGPRSRPAPRELPRPRSQARPSRGVVRG
jgi:O-acetylserine/cysteine efflux transporter